MKISFLLSQIGCMILESSYFFPLPEIMNIVLISIFSFGLAALSHIFPILPIKVVIKPVNQQVKAIYLTAYTVGDESRFSSLVSLVDDTELNAVVIDLKDYSGRVFVKTPESQKNGSFKPLIPDIQSVIKKLKEKNIYTIARIAVFQDPYLADYSRELAVKDDQGSIWRDYKGLSWVDASRKEVWDYNLKLAKFSASLGFDEINFDYVRFPSDGNISVLNYQFEQFGRSKIDVIGEFFSYTSRELKYLPVRTSVDLFGMTVWKDDGLGIGQRFADAVGNFDYIYPMVYPSHFPDGFQGYANPAEYPYEIVYNSLVNSSKILSKKMTNSTKVRPWIQDFDLGADYNADMVMQQIKAADDAGSPGWLLWNASNRYTESALGAE